MSYYEQITGGKKKKQTYYDQIINSNPTSSIEEIAPIKSTVEIPTTETKKNKLIKSSSLFDDGYQFGDITKTIRATKNSLLANIGKGFLNTVEGVADTARVGIGNLTKQSADVQAKVWDFLGNESYANELRKAGQKVKEKTYKNATMDVTGAILGETNDIFTNNWSKNLQEQSIAGSIPESVAQGIGNIGAFVGLSKLTGGSNLATFGNSFTSAYGNTLTNALRNGETEKEAKGQAITSGLAEAISEQFFQGIPGLKSAGWADNLISKPIGKYFSGKTGKVALKVFDSLGEGLEEVISNVLQSTFEGIRKGDNVKQIWNDATGQITNEETRDAFISALISSALTNGGSALITNQQKNSIIKSYAEEHDMSVEETKNLFDSIVEKKANLEDTSNYKERVDLEENIGRNLAKEMKGNVDLNELFKTTPSSKQEMQFRFNQDEANNVKSEKQNILANDMARINDVEENHKLYKIVNAIQSANDTQQYHITTTEGLYEMGIVNKDENGNYTMPDGSPYVPRGLNYKNGEIYINADVGSQSGTQAVYHEMFEGFKKAAPEQYNEFKQMVTDIIGEENIQKEFDTYKSMYGEELTDDIRDEIINDKFGELAENQNFINKIADNRNVLEKFIDSIKNMIKYVKGTDEERQLMKLQKNLEKEFAKRYKETDFSQGKGDTAYSLKESKAMLEKQFKDLTGDSLLVAEAKLGNYAFQQIRGNQVEAPYNQEAMDLLEKIQNSKKTSSHLYHSTPADRIQSIAKNGLVVGSKQNQEGVSSTNKLYLSATEELADSFTPENSVMLRISPNAKLENLDNDLLGGEGSYTITNNIEPKYLQVKENGKWIPLLKSKYANDTKYSLTSTKDSQGRNLTPQQQEYFKDSKVVDDNGNLKVMYRGGNENINVFDTNHTATRYTNLGTTYEADVKGFFFTDNIEYAKEFGTTKEYYLNVTNPVTMDNIDDLNKIFKPMLDDMLQEQDIYQWQYDKAVEENTIYRRFIDENGIDWQDIDKPAFNESLNIMKELGYDGFYTNEGNNERALFVFNSNQIKSTDNLNPTTSDDIRESLTSNKNIESKEIAPVKTMEETIAPIREDINNISKQMNDLSEQIKTLQNQPEMASNEEIAPIRPTYQEMQRANAVNNTEISPEEAYKDENYWNTIDEIAQENNNQLDSKLAKKLSKNMASELGLKKKQIDDMQSIINEAWDEGLSYDQIRLKLWEEFGHGTVMQKNEEAIDAQREIRNHPINVSDAIKSDIADYGYWKQNYFGKIKFSKDGLSVDKTYQELNEYNPGLFPSDIANPTDQLLRIAEVADLEKKYSVDYEMSLQDMDAAANYIHDTFVETMYNNAMKQQTDLEEQALQYNERTKDIPYKKKTRAEVREFLQNGMGITTEDLQAGNDIKALSYQITTPERVNEKVFGREVGKKINEQTVNFAKHQEAERIRFLAKERQEIADLGIKARSKESALVQEYGEGKLDDVQLAQAVEDKATQDKIKHAAKVLRQKYDDYLDMINEELVDMGYDPIPKRKDYMRHFQELTDKFSMVGIPFNRQDLNANNLPTDINGLTEFNVPGKNWFASALKRTGDKTTFDAITGIDGYLEGASNLMYHTETIQRYRALEKLIRDTYGQTHGMDVFGDDISSEQAMQRLQDIENGKLSNYVAWLKEQGNAIAGKKTALDRAPERLFGRKGYSFFNTLKKSTGSNMTGLNVRSALTNFISSTIAASKTNKMAMAHGTIDTIKNMFHDDGFINKSDFLTSRLKSDTSLSKKTWQKIANAGQIFMSGSDWFTSNLIVRSKYYEGLSKGMTESQAMKYADDFGARVMGDRSKGATAEAFNSKTLGFLTQFQLETNNQWQYMIHDSKMEFQENLAKEGGLKAGATLVFQMGQLAAYSYLFNEMFEQLTGSRAAFDPVDIFKKLFAPDDDDKDKTFEERMKEAGKELADALPFTSLFGSGGRLPISDMLTPAGTLYDYITGGTNKYGQEITLKDVKDEALSSLPYYVLPTGYGQLKKTVQGLGMYDKDNPVPGSYTDSGNLRYTANTDTASVIKNALFGQWSGEEAKKYRESGYKTIRANDIQEMKDLGMSSSEYREYKENLKEAGSKNSDKLDYISSLNIPINEKNIMASNVVDRPVDMSNYNSYEEFDYAYKNPSKYKVATAITDFSDYQKYTDEIKTIKDNTKEDKKETIKYINSLDLTIPQKAMFIKQYYPTFNNYNKEIVNYIASSDMSYEDKVEVLKSLKFKVDDEGNVSW